MPLTKADAVGFDLVIFDCDGVLVDSELIACIAHAELLTRHGYPISSDQVYDRFLGRSLREATAEIEAELGRSLPAVFAADLNAEIHRSFTLSLRPVPHIAAALDRIALPVCVASSGTPDKIKSSLTLAKLYDRFAPNLFSATQVRNGKPAPDLFLFAAASMKVDPARCLVIEDSVPGVQAAVAAGMTAFGFCGGAHCRSGHAASLRAAGARASFDDMRQLTAMIEEFGKVPI